MITPQCGTSATCVSALLSHGRILAASGLMLYAISQDSNGFTPSERFVAQRKLVVLELLGNSHSV